MTRWSAERRIVPIARDVGRLETRPGVRRARSGASQAPSAVSALRSPSLGREGPPRTPALPAPLNKRAAKRCLRMGLRAYRNGGANGHKFATTAHARGRLCRRRADRNARRTAMTLTETRPSAGADTKSDLKIAAVEA